MIIWISTASHPVLVETYRVSFQIIHETVVPEECVPVQVLIQLFLSGSSPMTQVHQVVMLTSPNLISGVCTVLLHTRALFHIARYPVSLMK